MSARHMDKMDKIGQNQTKLDEMDKINKIA